MDGDIVTPAQARARFADADETLALAADAAQRRGASHAADQCRAHDKRREGRWANRHNRKEGEE